MKILKKGVFVIPKEVVLTGECEFCECQIECSPDDRGVMGDWYNSDVYRVLCPECKSSFIELKEKQ